MSNAIKNKESAGMPKKKNQSKEKNKNQQKKNNKFSWLFLYFMLLIYFILFIFNKQAALTSANKFIEILINIVPVLVLVFVLLFLIELFLEPKKISMHLGKSSGFKGYLIALIGGIISTGPVYIWYPLLKNMKERGMRQSLIVVFIYARAVKLPLLPLMVYYFGFILTILISFYLIVFSVLAGLIIEKLTVSKSPELNANAFN